MYVSTLIPTNCINVYIPVVDPDIYFSKGTEEENLGEENILENVYDYSRYSS